MGRVASALDNAPIASFWSSMELELLDCRVWDSRVDLAAAIFESIEACYIHIRRHITLRDSGGRSTSIAAFDAPQKRSQLRRDQHTTTVRNNQGRPQSPTAVGQPRLG